MSERARVYFGKYGLIIYLYFVQISRVKNIPWTLPADVLAIKLSDSDFGPFVQRHIGKCCFAIIFKGSKVSRIIKKILKTLKPAFISIESSTNVELIAKWNKPDSRNTSSKIWVQTLFIEQKWDENVFNHSIKKKLNEFSKKFILNHLIINNFSPGQSTDSHDIWPTILYSRRFEVKLDSPIWAVSLKNFLLYRLVLSKSWKNFSWFLWLSLKNFPLKRSDPLHMLNPCLPGYENFGIFSGFIWKINSLP